MAKDAQVLVRVDEDTKGDWIDAKEERGMSSLADFIRLAVNNEINGRHGSGGNTTEAGDVDLGGLPETVSDIDERTEDVKQKLIAMEAVLESVREDVSDGGGTVAPELIFEHLPNVDLTRVRDDIEDPSSVPSSEAFRRPTDEEIVAEAKTPEEVAADIGVPTAPVRRTLEELALESERVYTHETDSGQRRYFVNV